jgi:hypothetical protein
MSTGGTQLAGITTASMERSIRDTAGPIGKWHSMVIVAAGTTVQFTSSFAAADPGAGFSGVLCASDANIADTKIGVTGGGEISGDDLADGTIYDLDVTHVTADSGVVYVFKKGS